MEKQNKIKQNKIIPKRDYIPESVLTSIKSQLKIGQVRRSGGQGVRGSGVGMAYML